MRDKARGMQDMEWVGEDIRERDMKGRHESETKKVGMGFVASC